MTTDRTISNISDWLELAEEKLAQGTLSRDDLQELRQLASNAKPSTTPAPAAKTPQPKVLQRLLYLHAVTPSIHAPVAAAALQEPKRGAAATIDPLVPDLPYYSVHDAILDGWRVVHFPDQRSPFDDREIDVVGFEFILEKLEAFDE